MGSAASISMPEGSPANIYTATAVDADNDTLSFGVAGGADEAAFKIDAASGAAGLCRTLVAYRVLGPGYKCKWYNYHRFMVFLRLRFLMYK
jgi:hypothetical protein